MTSFKTPKGTELPMLNLKGKDYLMVAYRLVWFREEHPDWKIDTELLQRGTNERTGADYVIFRATVSDKEGNVLATGHKYEDEKGFPDYIEKSETGAIGRTLAFCGYGTQFAPELDEQHRLADSPTQRKPTATVFPESRDINPHEAQNLETETFPGGVHTGKTFREVLEKDKKVNFKYSDWAKHTVETSHTVDVKPYVINFYKYAKLCGVYEVQK